MRPMSPTEEKLHAALDSLHTREDFVLFVELLVESFKEPGPPWERNNGVVSCRSGPGCEEPRDILRLANEAAQNVDSPSWEAVAGLLFSARCARDPK